MRRVLSISRGNHESDDYLAPYRKIKNLIVIGPREIEKAFRKANDKDPLRLGSDWCPKVEVPYSPEKMAILANHFASFNWNSKIILWLALPTIAQEAGVTSLCNQRRWWGDRGNGFKAGIIRPNILCSSWFVQNKAEWTTVAAVSETKWLISYERLKMACPEHQQAKLAERYGLKISSAVQETLMLILAEISGAQLRRPTYTFTSTETQAGTILIYRHQGNICIFSGNRQRVNSFSVALEGYPTKLPLRGSF